MKQRMVWFALAMCLCLGAVPVSAETPGALPGLPSLVPAGDQCALPAEDPTVPAAADPLPFLAAPAPDGGCHNFCCTSSAQCVQRCGDAAACVGSGLCKRCILL